MVVAIAVVPAPPGCSPASGDEGDPHQLIASAASARLALPGGWPGRRPPAQMWLIPIAVELYKLGGLPPSQIPGGAPDGVRLQWDATGQRLRADPVGRPVYAIADLSRGGSPTWYSPAQNLDPGVAAAPR